MATGRGVVHDSISLSGSVARTQRRYARAGDNRPYTTLTEVAERFYDRMIDRWVCPQFPTPNPTERDRPPACAQAPKQQNYRSTPFSESLFIGNCGKGIESAYADHEGGAQ
jgi:hypothetical protein